LFGLAVDYDVLLISPTSRGAGGVARHVEGLARHLSASGYKIGIISSENTPIIKVRGLKNPSFMFSSSIKALKVTARVVHAHNLPSAPAMKIVDSQRRVLTIHGVYAEQIELLHGHIFGRLASVLERVFFGWADILTAVSSQATHTYIKKGFRVQYIPNAVDLPAVNIKGKRIHDKQVVFVGRLSREKNVEALLEAARKIKEAVFVIVGNGPDWLRLKQLSRDIANVVFTGYLSHEEALQYIAGSDILILPSYAEGLSTVILEAMVLRTPVIASNIGGNVELIEDMKTGLLVNPYDIESIVNSIVTLLDDPNLAQNLAEKAYEKVVKNYSWNVVLPKYLEVYGLA